MAVSSAALCLAFQAEPASTTAPASQPEAAAIMPKILQAGSPESSGPFDIPLPMWIVLGTCAALGTAGLTISWRQKKKRQRRPVTIDRGF